jgi:hypothetical protein
MEWQNVIKGSKFSQVTCTFVSSAQSFTPSFSRNHFKFVALVWLLVTANANLLLTLLHLTLWPRVRLCRELSEKIIHLSNHSTLKTIDVIVIYLEHVVKWLKPEIDKNINYNGGIIYDYLDVHCVIKIYVDNVIMIACILVIQ